MYMECYFLVNSESVHVLFNQILLVSKYLSVT